MANGRRSRGNSVVGERWPLFWTGCAAISVGVALHLPMLAMAHTMGNHLSGMPMDGWMYMGMALIGIGVPGGRPPRRGLVGTDHQPRSLLSNGALSAVPKWAFKE